MRSRSRSSVHSIKHVHIFCAICKQSDLWKQFFKKYKNLQIVHNSTVNFSAVASDKVERLAISD